MDNSVAAPETPAITQSIALIRRDDALWPRAGLDLEQVREIKALFRDEGPEAVPPILPLCSQRRVMVRGIPSCCEQFKKRHRPLTSLAVVPVEC